MPKYFLLVWLFYNYSNFVEFKTKKQKRAGWRV